MISYLAVRAAAAAPNPAYHFFRPFRGVRGDYGDLALFLEVHSTPHLCVWLSVCLCV